MGLWEDITRPFSDIIDSINREYTRASNDFQRAVSDAGRGDVGAFVAKTGKSFLDVARSPYETAFNVSTGNFSGAKDSTLKAVGSGMNLAGGLSGYIGQTSSGQNFLENKQVDKFTGGLSGDYAGTLRGANELEYNSTISRENLDDTLRFGAKIGTVAGASAAYSAYQGASSVGGSAIPGYVGAAKTGAVYAKDGALVYGAGSALARGDVAGAVNSARQISGDYGDYLPEVPTAPDWVPDFGAIWDSITGGGGGGSNQPVINDPLGLQTGSGQVKAAGISVLSLALLAGTVYLIKKAK